MQTPMPPQGELIKMLWITDPWSTLDHSQDTTLRLMQEAIIMGIPTFWSPSDQLFLTTQTGHIQAVRLDKTINLIAETKFKLEPFPLSSFHQIHNRIDPPVDENYRSLIDQLIEKGAKESQILNPPSLLKNQSEKIPPVDLQSYSPRLKIIESEENLREAEEIFSGDLEIVSKPLHLAQSIGVEKHRTPKNAAEWGALAGRLTHNFTQAILIEEFLPKINSGEVRMWFAGEQFIAALKKHPIIGDFRVLIDEGSRIEAYTLTPPEEKIAAAVGQSLKRQGILMAAVDLIGDKICDYNFTSPGLLVQLEKVHAYQNFAKVILNQALQYRGPAVHE